MGNDLARVLNRHRRGERNATEEIVRRAGRIAVPVAAAVLGNHQDATDVAQDVAVDVLAGVERLRDPDRFDPWVRKIAVRRALRAVSTRRRQHAELCLDELAEAAAPDRAALIATREALRVALGSLTPEQRAAVALRYVLGLPEQDVADALGVRLGTASSLLARARSLLARDRALQELAPSRRGVI